MWLYYSVSVVTTTIYILLVSSYCSVFDVFDALILSVVWYVALYEIFRVSGAWVWGLYINTVDEEV